MAEVENRIRAAVRACGMHACMGVFFYLTQSVVLLCEIVGVIVVAIPSRLLRLRLGAYAVCVYVYVCVCVYVFVRVCMCVHARAQRLGRPRGL